MLSTSAVPSDFSRIRLDRGLVAAGLGTPRDCSTGRSIEAQVFAVAFPPRAASPAVVAYRGWIARGNPRGPSCRKHERTRPRQFQTAK